MRFLPLFTCYGYGRAVQLSERELLELSRLLVTCGSVVEGISIKSQYRAEAGLLTDYISWLKAVSRRGQRLSIWSHADMMAKVQGEEILHEKDSCQ